MCAATCLLPDPISQALMSASSLNPRACQPKIHGQERERCSSVVQALFSFSFGTWLTCTSTVRHGATPVLSQDGIVSKVHSLAWESQRWLSRLIADMNISSSTMTTTDMARRLTAKGIPDCALHLLWFERHFCGSELAWYALAFAAKDEGRPGVIRLGAT